MAEPDSDAPPARRSDGTFRPGHSTSTGRPPGSPNKVNHDLRAGILSSAKRHGRDGKGLDGLAGYFDYLAAERPKDFSQHVGRMIPRSLDVDASIDGGTVNFEIVSIPQRFYFLPESYKSDPWLYDSAEVANMEAIRRAARERAEKVRRDLARDEDV